MDSFKCLFLSCSLPSRFFNFHIYKNLFHTSVTRLKYLITCIICHHNSWLIAYFSGLSCFIAFSLLLHFLMHLWYFKLSLCLLLKEMSLLSWISFGWIWILNQLQSKVWNSDSKKINFLICLYIFVLSCLRCFLS